MLPGRRFLRRIPILLMAGFACVLHVLPGVKQPLGVSGIDRGQGRHRRIVEPIDEPGPCHRVIGDHPLNSFGLQLDAGVLGLLAVLRDQTAGNRSRFVASTSCTALRGRPPIPHPSWARALRCRSMRRIVATGFQRTSDSGSTIDVMMSLTVAVGLNWGCGGRSSRRLQPPAIRTNTTKDGGHW